MAASAGESAAITSRHGQPHGKVTTDSHQGLITAMLTLSRQTPKRGTTCQRCLIIRYFILMAFALAMVLIAADGGLAYLGSATPMHAAMAVITVGMIGFVIKVVLWKLEDRAPLTSGRGQAAPPEASPQGTDQTSSH